MRKTGYKMTRPDGTDFYSGKIQYAVGLVLECTDCDETTDACGKGLHLGKERYSPLQYNVKYPWRLFECSFDAKDILGEDNNKVRVRRLTVEKALDPRDIGIPNADRFFSIITRATKIKLRHNPAALKKIEKCIKKQCKLLGERTGKKIPYRGMKAYTIHEWYSVLDSVRFSVWSSVRFSVWDSVLDSVRFSVWSSVRFSVWDSVRDSVRFSVRSSVRDSVWDSVWSSVWDSVRYSVLDSVWSSVWDSVRYSVLDSVRYSDEENIFLPELEILELGAVLYGIDNDGVAHVVMPSDDEVLQEGGAP